MGRASRRRARDVDEIATFGSPKYDVTLVLFIWTGLIRRECPLVYLSRALVTQIANHLCVHLVPKCSGKLPKRPYTSMIATRWGLST